MPSAIRLSALLVQTLRAFFADRAPMFAAALSFYGIISLGPLAILAVWGAGLFFGESAAEGQVYAQVHRIAGEEGASFVRTVLRHAESPEASSAALVSLCILFVSASVVFAQLQTALNTIWGVPERSRGLIAFLLQRVIAMGTVVVIGVLVMASLASATAISMINRMATDLAPGVSWWGRLVDFGGMTLIFALFFAFLFQTHARVQIHPGPLFVGAIVTSLLFNFGRLGVAAYLAGSGLSSTYGAAASLLALLLWIYYSSLSVLAGAEFTKVYAKLRGAPLRPGSSRSKGRKGARRKRKRR